MAKTNREGSLGAKLQATLYGWITATITFVLKVIFWPLELFFNHMSDRIEDYIMRTPFPGEDLFGQWGGDTNIFRIMRGEMQKRRGAAMLPMLLAMLPALLGSFVGAMVMVFFVPVKNYINRWVRFEHPTVDQAIDAYIKKQIPAHELHYIAASAGLDSRHMDILMSSHRKTLDPGSLQDLIRRGKVSETVFVDELEKAGFKGAQIQLMRDLAERFPGVDTAIQAFIKKIIPQEELDRLVKAAGIDLKHMELLKAPYRKILGPRELQQLFLRGEIPESTFNDELAKQGFSEDSIKGLKTLAFYIPTPGDLIRMAVREAFSPEVAKRFGQYEDFPADFAKFAKMQGMSEEWAQRQWAAHWDLPSIGQGYEMLHRGIIGMDDLNLLLRAGDVMPYWRPKLVAAAYRPYSRVDVRRMYQVGTLDAAGVKRSYLDLGYQEEKATKMTQYTIAYSVQTDRELTKADVLDGFKRHLMTRQETVEMLEDLGYAIWEINFFIDRTLQKAEESQKKQLQSNVKTRFTKGTISEGEAIERLITAGVDSAEARELLSLWVLSRGERVYVPPVGKLEAFLKEGIITEDQFTEEMINKGTSAAHINWYIELIKIKEAE